MTEHELDNIGPGWVPLVRPLIDQLTSLDGRVAQIKEKFGTLRFYYDLPDSLDTFERESFQAMVRRAEIISGVTCEDCGQTGTRLTVAGWVKTLCANCAVTWDRKRIAGRLSHILSYNDDNVRKHLESFIDHHLTTNNG